MSQSKVWIDVLTPKQILFFAPVAEELRRRGCQVLVTSRRYREVGPMSRMCKLDLEFVGDRGGENQVDQLISSTKRQLQIIPLVRKFQPTVALSVASGVCARVSFGLRIPHVAVNDSPHSEVAGKLALPFSKQLLCPWIIPYEAWKIYGISRKQVTRYHALDPVAWLKRPRLDGPIPKLRKKGLTITIRLEESYAPYMVGTDRGLTSQMLEELAESYPDANLVALCRYGKQLDEIERRFGSRYIIPDGIVDGRRLLEITNLFIGMGGTMTTEAALLGVPSISAFQGVLFTELYLRSEGLLVKTKDPREVIRNARVLLEGGVRSRIAKKADAILRSMEDPVLKVADSVMKEQHI